MTNENKSTPKNETFTWLQPGAWRKPCIVHVTMVANSRQALFGKLAHNGTEAVVEKTPIGWALINQQRRLLELCPEIKILADKVMPDHHHIVLQVQRTMPRSIREVVRGYMQGCKEEARKHGFTENIYDGPPFYRVLTHKGQLHAMIEYVKANTERAWQRRQNPDLFRMHRKTEACGLLFTSMGNHFLLEWPDRQLVEMSRSASNFDACSKGRLLLMEPDKSAFVNPAVMMATEEALRRKAEAKHLVYTAVPVESQRYRFVALNEMGRMLVMRQHAV